MKATIVLALCLVVAVVVAEHGLDVSQPTSETHFRCLKNDGYEWAIVRAYESLNRPDPAAPATVKAAWAAGFKKVDVYMFPAPKSGNPEGQLRSMVSELNKHNVRYDRVWFDIEGTQYWHTDKAENVKFFEGLKSEGKKLGLTLGVYTSESQWSPIMGGSHAGADLPLWYAHYDGQESFHDFSAFGGWTKPHAKQFADNGNACSASYDKNWLP